MKSRESNNQISTWVYEDSLLCRISYSFSQGTPNRPVVSCCRRYNSTGLVAAHDTLCSREGASLGGGTAFAVVVYLPRLASLVRISDGSRIGCLERERPRADSSFDISLVSALSPLLMSRCRHSALKPFRYPTSFANLSAIATLLCLPMLQWTKHATQPPCGFSFRICFNLSSKFLKAL